MANGKARDVVRERTWRKILQRQQQSGLSVRAFCRKQGLAETAFAFWKRELRRRDGEGMPAAAFVELAPMLQTAPPAEAPIELRIAGRRLLLRRGCDLDLLGRVLQLLEARPC